MAMNTKTLKGKVKVFPAGHKVNGTGTWYRDENGNYHAEFYKATVGQVEEDGKYHSYSFNVAPDEAEAFANMNIGTVFEVTVLPKMKTETNDDGEDIVVEKATENDSHTTVYHEVTLEGIDVVKEGAVKRPRTTQYFADVKWDPKTGKESEKDRNGKGL